MPRNYIAFDIETAKIIPGEVQDLKSHRPLGITCAATLSSTDDSPRLWCGRDADQQPAARMSREEASSLVTALSTAADAGATIVTWNGLGFDFDILAEESGMFDECRSLARNHVDMMFHVLCQLGYPIGLDRAAQGMRLQGKSTGVAQHLAPQLWADGKTDDVLEYVSQDVRTTLDIARTAESRRGLSWITGRGKVSKMPLDGEWLTVEAALLLPKPDTSWMSTPISRKKFTAWLK